MATQRREQRERERGDEGEDVVDLENHRPHPSVLLSSSTTPSPPKKKRHPFSSASMNETNTDDGKEQTSHTSLKVLCYLLIFIASFVFYEDLLVARVAVRKHFFGLESGVGASQLLGEEEPESDLIDTRTGKLDLNLRHISKRKRERVETIEEHNEKELIDRVGLDKAEEIVEEEQEEKEGAEMALQIEKEEEEKKKREKEEAEARRRIEEEEEETRRKKEEEKKEVLERERREMEEMGRAKEDAKEDEEKKEALEEEEAKKQSEESKSSRDDRNTNNINLGEEPEHFSEKTKEGSYVRATSHYGLSWSPPAPTAPPTPTIPKVVEEAVEIGDSTAISLEDQAPNFDIFTGGALPLSDPEDTPEEHEWRSIGQVMPINGMDLDFPGNLKVAAERRSFRKEIILFVSNRGGNHLAANTVANLRKLGFEHYILITNTAETCYDLLKGPWGVDCGWTSFLQNRAKQMGTFQVTAEEQATPFRLWWVRFHYMERLVGMGYNPMYVDTDVRFEMNPYPLLKSPPFDKFTLFAQDENGHPGGLNIGCVYAQNAPEFGVTRWVLNETVSRMLRIIDTEPPLQKWNGQVAAGAKETLWDQHIFNDVVETAVSGKPVFKRSMQRLIDPGDGNRLRDDWVKNQNYDHSAWDLSMEKIDEKVLPLGLKDVDVRPMKVDDTYEIKSKKFQGLKGFSPTENGKDPNKDEYVCGFPPWFVSGWSGIAGPAQVQGQPGYWTAKPARIVMGHAVGALRKTTTFKGLGWWNYGAEAYKPYKLQNVEEKLGKKGVLGFIGLKTNEANAIVGVESHGLSVARVVEIATSAGRRPISPTVPCDAPWIEKNPSAMHGIMMRHQIVLSQLCGRERNEMCCQSLNFDCDEGVMLEVDFWNDPRYARFRDDIIVVSAKDVVNDSGNEIDLSTIEVKIDSLSQGKKTVFVDLAALEDSSIVPKGVGEAKYVPERDAIFATCDRLDCRPPNKPFPSEHEPCRRVTS
tara:strand:+ start:2073 stop:5012 length:2940 start_codon:yes stop_codon:yes gene_type:complete